MTKTIENPKKFDLSSIPREALRLEGARFQLAESGDGDPLAVRPVSILCRTAGVINHWWFGPIVHDLAGAQLKPKVSLDWCHDYDEQIGYLDQFEITPEGLVGKGKIVPFKADDRASELLFKGDRGVPYEASIDWTGDCRLEELDYGMTAVVNGQVVTGPCLIVREWPLTAVAVCPHGADGGTQTKFRDGPGKGTIMTKTTDTKPTEGGGGKTFSSEDLQLWRTQFGTEGVDWLLEGLTFDQAKERFAANQAKTLNARIEELTKAVAGKDDEIAKLTTKLDAAKKLTQTEDPVKGSAEPLDDKPKSFVKLKK